jgi:hypothetical protein
MQTAIVGSDVTALKAREAFLAYRNLVREGRATEDDELLMRSYRAIAQGKRVLDLRETLKLGGLDEQLRPRLAIARADLQHVVFGHSWHAERWCYRPDGRSGRLPFSDGRAIAVTRGVYPLLDGASYVTKVEGKRPGYSRIRAAVPPIPAHLRPPATALSGLHILWEAEWEPVAPRDPILLKRIGGFLYAVLAQWDLTELERAVLGARLS